MTATRGVEYDRRRRQAQPRGFATALLLYCTLFASGCAARSAPASTDVPFSSTRAAEPSVTATVLPPLATTAARPSPTTAEVARTSSPTAHSPIANRPMARVGPPRVNAHLVYDDARREVVLFGGYSTEGGGTGRLGDTWTWDGRAWTERQPTRSPSARQNAHLVYDEAREQVVLFGGATPGGVRGDMWTWNGEDWRRRRAGRGCGTARLGRPSGSRPTISIRPTPVRAGTRRVLEPILIPYGGIAN